jgi:hypothetical protein
MLAPDLMFETEVSQQNDVERTDHVWFDGDAGLQSSCQPGRNSENRTVTLIFSGRISGLPH